MLQAKKTANFAGARKRYCGVNSVNDHEHSNDKTQGKELAEIG